MQWLKLNNQRFVELTLKSFSDCKNLYFLSAVEGERPMYYTSCCGCSCWFLFKNSCNLSLSCSLLSIILLTFVNLPVPTYLRQTTYVNLPTPTNLNQHTYLPISTHLPTYVYLPTHTNPCQPTIIYLPSSTNPLIKYRIATDQGAGIGLVSHNLGSWGSTYGQ